MARRFYSRHKATIKISRRVYLKKAKAITRATRLKYDANTVEQRRQRNKAYYLANRAKWINHKLLRRSREKTTPEERERCLNFIISARNRRRNVCYYCSTRVVGVPHIDHILALARGGRHEVSNLCVSHKSCNLSKQAKLIAELDLPQRLLPI